MSMFNNNRPFFGTLSILAVLADIFGVYQGMRDLILNGFSSFFWTLFVICFLFLYIFSFIIKECIPNCSILNINFLDLCAGVYSILIITCSSLAFYYFYFFEKFYFFETCGYFMLLIFSLLLFGVAQYFSKNPEMIFNILSYFLAVKTILFFVFLIIHVISKSEAGSSLLLFIMTAYSGVITAISLIFKDGFAFHYENS